jgi:thiamine biosynthesis lipoprotein
VERLHTTFRALGCPCELQLISDSRDQLEDVAARSVAELQRIEAKYSRYRDDSILSQINARAGSGVDTRVDDETSRMLDYADTAYRQSGGLFDITSGVLRRAWDFKNPRVPDASELTPLLALVGWRKVQRRGPHFLLPHAEMQIDFGGFGKEYAADRVADLCRQAGLRSGLVDLGGDICIVGPHPDGSPWQVGIRDPRNPAEAMAGLSLSCGSMATSGSYERFIEVDGKRYCHVLDPRTGWPVHGLAGVSVVAERCLLAGTASTVALLKGRSGSRWLAQLGLPHLWIDDDDQRGGSLWPRGQPVQRAGLAHAVSR